MACCRYAFRRTFFFTASPADIAGVSVVVGEEDLLVERAVARLVAAAGRWRTCATRRPRDCGPASWPR